MSQELLRIGELSARLNIPERTLRFWVTKRQIPFLRVDRILYFEPESVLAIMRQRGANVGGEISVGGDCR